MVTLLLGNKFTLAKVPKIVTLEPAGPVEPVDPVLPVGPVFPVRPVAPVSPCGPFISPTFIQLLVVPSVQTHKLLCIRYPSPTTFAEIGNIDVFAKAPFITIVPGFTPPIVEPEGKEIPPSSAEIVTPSPKSKV